jgi:hypothetical protein
VLKSLVIYSTDPNNVEKGDSGFLRLAFGLKMDPSAPLRSNASMPTDVLGRGVRKRGGLDNILISSFKEQDDAGENRSAVMLYDIVELVEQCVSLNPVQTLK